MFIRFFLSAFVRGALVEFWRNLTSLVNRFSQLATYCVFIALFTGIILSYVNVKEISVLMNTHYGMVLLGKILLVGIIAIIGGFNKFFVIPDMNNIKTDESSEGLAHVSKLLKLMTLESSLAFIVLLLTSILTHLSPEG
jgi:putative copper resistance protein D